MLAMFISHVRQLQQDECREQQLSGTESQAEPAVQAVQTRAQSKAEEKAKQLAEGTRQEEQVQQLHPDNCR